MTSQIQMATAVGLLLATAAAPAPDSPPPSAPAQNPPAGLEGMFTPPPGYVLPPFAPDASAMSPAARAAEWDKLQRLANAGSPAKAKAWSSCEEMHRYYVAKFIATSGFGVSRMASPVMGLDRDTPLIETRILDGVKVQSTFVGQKLDLIGIARHEQPVALLPSNHGANVIGESRPLTEFEQKSLAELNAGKEVVTGTDTAGRWVVGAIRARASCLECHGEYGEGGLLGAFSYRLRPASAAPAAAPEKTASFGTNPTLSAVSASNSRS